MKQTILTILKILLLTFFTSCARTDWRTASRDSVKIAPLPSVEKEAVVQIYGAKTINWRGNFSLHCWISIKEKNASEYTNYHVVGWRTQRGLGTVREENDIPDRRWYGAEPHIIASYIGPKAEVMIPQIRQAVKDYPYPDFYRAWPGPNSNTFVSFIIRSVPGMGIELPTNAIGKDWIKDGDVVSWSETKTGVQFSLLGALGFTLGLAEGVEVNVLGLSLGVDFWRPALKLPFFGRLGFKDAPVFD